MKRAGYFLLVTAMILMGCGVSKRESAAMENAFKAKKEAWAITQNQVHKHLLTPAADVLEHRRLFMEEAKKVDVSQCPKDFQAAWISWLEAYKRDYFPSDTEKKIEHLRETATKGSLEVGPTKVGVSHDNTSQISAADSEQHTDSNAYFEKVEKVAQNYGINPLNFE